MAGFYINSGIGYYEGDQISPDDIDVPKKQNPSDTWSGSEWIININEWNEQIWRKIDSLERSQQMPRTLRDLAIKSLTEDAAGIGLTLEQVYQIAVDQGDTAPSAAKQYKKFKDFCDSIDALKAQLK